jgi:hypothetical protein
MTKRRSAQRRRTVAKRKVGAKRRTTAKRRSVTKRRTAPKRRTPAKHRTNRPPVKHDEQNVTEFNAHAPENEDTPATDDIQR